MLVDDTWQDAFKRGIVMADARITPVERRANVTRLDTYVINIPPQVRPVYQLWRDGQTLQLQLSEERFRYSKLQQSSDSEALMRFASSRSRCASSWKPPPASSKI